MTNELALSYDFIGAKINFHGAQLSSMCLNSSSCTKSSSICQCDSFAYILAFVASGAPQCQTSTQKQLILVNTRAVVPKAMLSNPEHSLPHIQKGAQSCETYRAINLRNLLKYSYSETSHCRANARECRKSENFTKELNPSCTASQLRFCLCEKKGYTNRFECHWEPFGSPETVFCRQEETLRISGELRRLTAR